jgi:hypothetical protein
MMAKMRGLTLLKILLPKKAVPNPIEIQLKSTVNASEIAHHKPRHSIVNIGRIDSIKNSPAKKGGP